MWRKPLQFKAEYSVDIPEKPQPGKLYLVGSGEHIWCAAFVCPCGCKELVQLSLLPTSSPRWDYRLEAERNVSLFPSVRRVRGCRSHFFVKHGQIEWVCED